MAKVTVSSRDFLKADSPTALYPWELSDEELDALATSEPDDQAFIDAIADPDAC